MVNKRLIIFLQDIRPFEKDGGAGFLELVQQTMDSRQQISRHYTMFIIIFLCYIIKQYVCITVYLCFVFIIR